MVGSDFVTLQHKNTSYQSTNEYPFIVWYDTSNIPTDNNAFGIYITYITPQKVLYLMDKTCFEVALN